MNERQSVCVGERGSEWGRDRKSELVSVGKKIAGRQQIKQAAVTNQLAARGEADEEEGQRQREERRERKEGTESRGGR